VPESLAANLVGEDDLVSLKPWFFRLGGIAAVMRSRWDSLCWRVSRSGQIDELQSARTAVQTVLDRHIALFEDYLALLDLTEQITAHDGSARQAREQVVREMAELRRLHDEIFPRWQTVDDVAEMILEKFSLTQAELRAIAAANPPQQSWYEETIDPFASE
jgi:hypothetical protein